MARKFDSYSIEPKNERGDTLFAVYGFGVYPDSSVLAGQTSKSFIAFFDTEEDARRAYPSASIGWRDPANSVAHLPEEDDPVPGGRYLDDYAD